MEVSSQFRDPAALPPDEIPAGTYRTRGWVGPRTGLDAVEKIKISAPARNRNPIPRLLKS
jgi:hypothetical protein